MSIIKETLIFTLIGFLTVASVSFFSSCSTTASLNREPKELSVNLYASGIQTEDSLVKFFRSRNRKMSRSKVKEIARYYIEEASQEGINSDAAFVQMCLETDFLRYGNLVKKEWNNFCGLGAIDKDNPGLKFNSVQEGVRAHIQHLHAYATTEDIVLVNETIDPRYKYVKPRGKAADIFGLSGTWAADREYGNKLNKLLTELSYF